MQYDETSQSDLKASRRELQVTIVSGHGRPIPHAAIAENEAAEFKNIEIGTSPVVSLFTAVYVVVNMHDLKVLGNVEL